MNDVSLRYFTDHHRSERKNGFAVPGMDGEVHTMTIAFSREVRLVSRPNGLPAFENFTVARVAIGEPKAGEVQVRNIFFSVDPDMRGRMEDVPSYVPPFALGEALQGGAVGTVVASNDGRFAPGDLVSSMAGWREAFNASGDTLRKVSDRLPPETYLGIAGLTGLTAFVGMNVAEVRPGDVVFVSAASGAVGSAACQIAKIMGAVVVGSAGGAEKCDFLRAIGVDHVIDYKAVPDLAAAVSAAAPEGLDVCFDNVGGSHLEAALTAAKPYARFALCGMISQYNGGGRGPCNLALAVKKRLRMQGFIVSDHFDQMPDFIKRVTRWIEEGRVTWRQTIAEGIENAPDAFLKLFSGGNLGKMLVSLDRTADLRAAPSLHR